MKIQLAIDVLTLKEAMETIEQTYDYIDIIELGTPLMLSEGMHAIREVKKLYPDKPLFADCKIADGAGVIAAAAFDAGADIVNCLAFTDDYTVRQLVKAAHDRGKKCEADILCQDDIVEKRAQELMDLNVDYICYHGHCESRRPFEHNINEIRRFMNVVPRERTSICNFLDFGDMDEVVAYRPELLVVYKPIMLVEMNKRREAAKRFHDYVRTNFGE